MAIFSKSNLCFSIWKNFYHQILTYIIQNGLDDAAVKKKKKKNNNNNNKNNSKPSGTT